ncbi:MAG: hypothetical protein IJ064_05625 [Bacteroidaceae bacterium]|nr:hypothetical protein [Bacteroidaceae bacterium]
MRIGILKETKTPIDNRVPITPEQAERLQGLGVDVVVESSDIRAYSDEEYRARGITITPTIAEAGEFDLLLGVKEVSKESLLPHQHYVFFSHIAKMQPYNRGLLQAIIQKGITLTDYEYLTDKQGKRTVAFGFYAGAVGAYNTIRLYGIKYGAFSLDAPKADWNVDTLSEQIREVLPILEAFKVKIIVTGTGRVSDGAQYVLNHAGIRQQGRCSYIVLCPDLIFTKDGQYCGYEREEFHRCPQAYISRFGDYIQLADILISCHYWDNRGPKMFTSAMMCNPRNRIQVVGDVTCDINGGNDCTIRPSTHAEPFYDYDPYRRCEVPFRQSEDNISVMAVDTCPNALPREASRAFGEMVIDNILAPMLKGDTESIGNATLVASGLITQRYQYLEDFANEEKENIE